MVSPYSKGSQELYCTPSFLDSKAATPPLSCSISRPHQLSTKKEAVASRLFIDWFSQIGMFVEVIVVRYIKKAKEIGRVCLYLDDLLVSDVISFVRSGCVKMAPNVTSDFKDYACIVMTQLEKCLRSFFEKMPSSIAPDELLLIIPEIHNLRLHFLKQLSVVVVQKNVPMCLRQNSSFFATRADQIDGVSYVFYQLHDLSHHMLYRKNVSFDQIPNYSKENHPWVGDVVVYLDSEYQHAHLAILKDGRRVVSKWGIDPFIYLHPINRVPTIYGNYVHFYRLKAKIPLYRQLQRHLLTAQKALERGDFSHPSLYSPLTSKGAAEYWVSWIVQKDASVPLLEGSLLGKRTRRVYADSVLQKFILKTQKLWKRSSSHSTKNILDLLDQIAAKRDTQFYRQLIQLYEFKS